MMPVEKRPRVKTHGGQREIAPREKNTPTGDNACLPPGRKIPRQGTTRVCSKPARGEINQSRSRWTRPLELRSAPRPLGPGLPRAPPVLCGRGRPPIPCRALGARWSSLSCVHSPPRLTARASEKAPRPTQRTVPAHIGRAERRRAAGVSSRPPAATLPSGSSSAPPQKGARLSVEKGMDFFAAGRK